MERRAFFEDRKPGFQAISGPGFSFPPHLHPQLELLYVEEGEMGVTVGKSSTVLAAGHLAVVFPNQIHSYQKAPREASIIMLIADLSCTGGHLDTLLRSCPECPFLDNPHSNILYAIGQLAEEYGRAEPDAAVYGPLMQLILARAQPSLKLRQGRSADHQDLLWQVVHYVNKHYREPLTLSMVAQGVGASPGRLSRVFSEKVGQGFPAYLARIRLSYAQAILQDTELSVTEAGEEAGFESQRSFFRVFRQQYGMTPLQYRKQSRRGRGPGEGT